VEEIAWWGTACFVLRTRYVRMTKLKIKERQGHVV